MLHEGNLFAVGLFECSIDGDVFQTWIEQILLPELPKNSVVVMDNATFHKRQAIITLLNQHGHSVLWLPPYSPDLNPIEKTWAHIKALRRKLRLNDVAELFWGGVLKSKFIYYSKRSVIPAQAGILVEITQWFVFA